MRTTYILAAAAVFAAFLTAGPVFADPAQERKPAEEITGTLSELSADKEYVIITQDGRPVRFRISSGKAEKAAPLIGKKVRVVFEKMTDPSLHALDIVPETESAGRQSSPADAHSPQAEEP